MAEFQLYVPILKQVEGGYQNLAADPGNYNSLGQRVGTNYGISARFYEDIIKRPPTVQDMKNLTLTRALQIYKVHFWDKIQGDLIHNQSIANIIADHAVNAGVGTISRMVQNVLNKDFNINLVVDGKIGNITVNFINTVNQQSLFNLIKKARENHYRSIGGVFLNVWLNRLKSFAFDLSEKKKEIAIGSLILFSGLTAFLIKKYLIKK